MLGRAPYFKAMTRKYALRDDQWERINDLLPGRLGNVGVTARNNRLFVQAVLYRYRVGIAWRDLPGRFGNFHVVHLRHSRWSRWGVWQRVFEVLAQDADNQYVLIDSSIDRRAPGAPVNSRLRAAAQVADVRARNPLFFGSVLHSHLQYLVFERLFAQYPLKFGNLGTRGGKFGRWHHRFA